MLSAGIHTQCAKSAHIYLSEAKTKYNRFNSFCPHNLILQLSEIHRCRLDYNSVKVRFTEEKDLIKMTVSVEGNLLGTKQMGDISSTRCNKRAFFSHISPNKTTDVMCENMSIFVHMQVNETEKC